jgi:glutamyl/glutaminyl-tRNA synthetase
MSPVRVRFAPSPTGFFHIGSARTALFNWLYARHTGGTFILRIEDTDQARNSEAFLNLIYESLDWLGMDWDEGPVFRKNGGGDYGPYRQSQRGDIYQRYKQQLLDSGRAYEKDGAIWFKLLGERYKVFDDHRKKEVEKVKSAPVVIDDQIRGRVERQEDEDFVIFRSDGNPVFHFVNVVDDIEMKVSHIIRGEDHLSNTSKHVRLYEGFGVTAPVFAHIPLILKSPEMGQGKMSKRDKGALIEEYQQRFFLPEALVNYLCAARLEPRRRPREDADRRHHPAVRPARREPEQRQVRRQEAREHEHDLPAGAAGGPVRGAGEGLFRQAADGETVMANEAYFVRSCCSPNRRSNPSTNSAPTRDISSRTISRSTRR